MPGFKAEAIDVYETSDLPEADQHLQADTDSLGRHGGGARH